MILSTLILVFIFSILLNNFELCFCLLLHILLEQSPLHSIEHFPAGAGPPHAHTHNVRQTLAHVLSHTCTYAHMHTFMHSHKHALARVYIHTITHACAHAPHARTHTCPRLHSYSYMHAQLHTSSYTHALVHLQYIRAYAHQMLTYKRTEMFTIACITLLKPSEEFFC